jgi:two-component system, NarL family, sensor kinase
MATIGHGRQSPPSTGAASAAARRRHLPSEVRAALWRFAVIGLVALALVGWGTGWLMRAEMDDVAVIDAVRQSNRMAQGAVGPFVTEGVEALEPAAIAALDRIIRPRLRNGSLHLSVRDGEGRILYADEETLIGAVDDLDATEREVLATGASAVVAVPGRDLGPTPTGRTVTVLSATSSTTGTPLLVMVQHPIEELSAVATELFGHLAPLFWLALGVLLLTQLPSAVLLASRVDRGQRARQELLATLVEASELERQRMARDLHDTVIQDLAGLAYALDSLERGGRRDDDGALLRRGHTVLLSSVETLRTMLTSLHPFDPEELSLGQAVEQLAHDLRHRDVRVDVDVAPDVAGALDRASTIVAYRVVREALSNVGKHAAATAVQVRLHVVDGDAVVEVHDDGRGFDLETTSAPDHFGLGLLREAAASRRGVVDITSQEGVGTSVVARIPLLDDGRAAQPRRRHLLRAGTSLGR